MLNRLTDSLNFQTQALVLRSERQRLIASNIANADTPGYQAREMNFAAALRQATSETQGSQAQNGGAAAGPTIATTQAGHIAAATGARAPANLLYANASQASVDRNTVDMDRERAAFADNSVKYEATLRFINSSVRTMLDAIKSPSQG